MIRGWQRIRPYWERGIRHLVSTWGRRCIPVWLCRWYLRQKGYAFSPLRMTPLVEAEDQETYVEFSIIIPVYNGMRYLSECLDSVLDQAGKIRYEVICVDDASTDESPTVLARYQEAFPDRLHIVRHEQNQGISVSRNDGIRRSRGRYVVLVDNDDYVSPSLLESLHDRILETDADLVQVTFDRVDENSKKIKTEPLADMTFSSSDHILCLQMVRGYIWGCAIRRTLFRQIQFPVGFWFEDMITRLILARLCSVITTLSLPLYYYRVHTENASKTVWKSRSIKAVDQYWLSVSLMEYGQTLGLPSDHYVNTILIEELGQMLWWRTRDMALFQRFCVFSLASRYVQDQGIIPDNLPLNIEPVAQALLQRDFLRWIGCFEG